MQLLSLPMPSQQLVTATWHCIIIIPCYRYGTDAAAVTNNALSTAGNSYLAFYNAAALGPKGVAKKIAKVIFSYLIL